jgi:acyl-CoA reductase-like NAD-dependent aldehyde dehydrogenase
VAYRHKLFINGKWVESSEKKELRSPFSGEVVANIDQASPAQMNDALEAAHDSFLKFRKVSRFARSRLLALIAQGIAERRQDLVALMVAEAGKPAMLSDGEVTRSITTFTVASEEAKRFGGEMIPLDIEASGRAYTPALSYWVPRGPVLAITPFNFPLNLVAHKVAPAFAVGASVLLKPAPQAPGCSAVLAEIFEKAAAQASDARDSIPLAAFQVLSCSNEAAALAVTDPRMAILSFTGSVPVGWMLQGQAIRKKVALELGGNAAVIVHKDADLTRAAVRCAFGAFAYAGQVCISVQKIFAHQDVFNSFRDFFISETKKVPFGDPARKDTVVGPIIDSKAADRIMSWIEEAKSAGAQVLIGGKRQGNVIEPTILTGVKPELKISCEEAFGPIVILESYKDFSAAIDLVNASKFGLQAGVFTDSERLVREALDKLEVGGILINEIPTYRADNMPYGGVKDSGLGREGVRYAMEEYSERRTLISYQG